MHWLYSVLRTGAQALVGYAVTWLAARGLPVPLEAQHWAVETLLVGGGIALYTALVRWLETRPRSTWTDRAARWLSKVLMLGLTTQPSYPRPAVEPPGGP